ncbi:DUF917 domain-containing protein [Nocardiopsis sp. CC223A]|uniref:DUF917 domain-containing protein n=1 Tax=Nocardiopsis sp. CC223A TaxID=3044051 RepID=UPI00278C418F|nr:DUF917 domain-containing protein [Nocardiopsis sp. CC223A]
MTRDITSDDVAALAAGAAIFGTGGGGAVTTSQIGVAAALDEHGPVRLRPVEDLTEDDTVIVMAGIGAPTVGIEMLPSAEQPETLLREAERAAGRPITVVMATEIGGSNGVGPVGWAAQLGLDVLDADGMGRAFPEATMVAMNVAGVPRNLTVLSDVVGNVTVMRTVDATWLERHVRAFSVAGGSLCLGASLLDAGDVPGAVIQGTVSRAIEVGHALLGAQEPVSALARTLDAAVLVSGKVVDVARRTEGGFVRGSVTIAGTGPERDRLLRVELQNENLVVLEDGEVLVSVPDLVTLVDSETGHAISTELLRFGQRVSVLAWACDPLWRTERGIEIAGPQAFGYDIAYVPFDAGRFPPVPAGRGAAPTTSGATA